MKVTKQEPKLKLVATLSGDQIDLRTLDTNVIIKRLEENIELRTLSVEKRIEKQLKTMQ